MLGSTILKSLLGARPGARGLRAARAAPAASRAVVEPASLVRQHARHYAATPVVSQSAAAATDFPVKYNRPRDAKFAKLTAEDIEYFKKNLSPGCVIQDEHELEGFNTDWMKKYKGSSRLVLRPKTTQEVSTILAYCNKRKLAVVPQGGNTGLVGGSVPVYDEIVLTTNAMNKILAFDETSGILTCEAGCVLEVVDNYLHERGFMMPLDLGAKGSCQIGGNVATNAGGLRLVRYGSLHGTVLGLQVVMADGTIVDNLSTLRKDNTGIHLNHLFIGSEGVLGVITAVSIVTPRKPASTQVAFLACESFDKVCDAFIAARKELGEIVSAIEYLDRPSMELVLKHLDGTRDPLPSPQPFYLLIEVSGSNGGHDEEKLSAFLERAMEAGLVVDGNVAQDLTQVKAFWKLREGISESLSKSGAVYKYDISLPVREMWPMVEDMKKRLGSKANVVSFGHLGDGNLHLNMWTPKFEKEVLELIEPFVYEWTASRRGSISAEHGLGVMKASHIGYSKSKEAVALMQSLKRTMDPNGILNPYKLLPPA
eukprot:tig00020927_g15967.t1